MTETNLYGNGAPAALAAPRNDPGLPQIEAPVVEEVDLAALTDGQTSLGLPHRRRRDDGSDEPVGPIPVTELAQSTGLPTRSKKTFDEDNLVLPEAPDGHIAPEISGRRLRLEARDGRPAQGWSAEPQPRLDVRLGQAGGAGCRPAPPPRPPPPPVPVCSPASAAAPRPASTDTGENLVVPGLVSEDQERAQLPAQSNAVRAPWMSSGAHAAPVEPMVVPQLADDDDSWEAQEAENREAQNAASAAALAAQAEQAEAAPAQEEAPAWEPTPAWDTAQVEAPAAGGSGRGRRPPGTPLPPRPSRPRSPSGRRPSPRSRRGRPPSPRAPAWEAPAAETAPRGRLPADETPGWEAARRRATPVWDDSDRRRGDPRLGRLRCARPRRGSRLGRARRCRDRRETPRRGSCLGRTGRRRDARPGRRPPPPRPPGTRRPSTTSPPGRRRSSARTLRPP